MKLQITIDDAASPGLRKLAQETLPQARQNLVLEASQRVLRNIMDHHPVDTGRSHAAWASAAAQLGVNITLRGSNPASIAEGRSQGTATQTNDMDRTEIHSTNSVDYIAFLEYGTTRMSPFAMVRRSLSAARTTLASLFSLTPSANGKTR